MPERKLGPDLISEVHLTISEAVWNGHPSIGTVREQIQALALGTNPAEACGFVLDSGGVVAVKNIAEAPWYSFVMDPLEVAGWLSTGRCVATWHSHPTGPAAPSDFDLDQAPVLAELAMLFMVYSVEEEDLATFRIEDGTFTLLSVESPE